MERITISDDYIVPVKSNFDGTLTFGDNGWNEKWYHIGDVVDMPWSGIKDIRKYGRKSFEKNWLILESTKDYTASQLYEALGVSEYYPDADKFKDVEVLISMKPKEIADYLKGMSADYRSTFTSYAKRLYRDGDPRMDSKAKIATLEKVLDVDFNEV